MMPIFRKDSRKFALVSQGVSSRLHISTALFVPLLLVCVSILCLSGILLVRANLSWKQDHKGLSLHSVEPIRSNSKFKISKKGNFLIIEDSQGDHATFSEGKLEEFTKYFETKIRDLTKSNLVGLLGSKDNTTVILQVDHSLTYESIRPVFYALAQNKIHSVGFEVNALSFSSGDSATANSTRHHEEHSK